MRIEVTCDSCFGFRNPRTSSNLTASEALIVQLTCDVINVQSTAFVVFILTPAWDNLNDRCEMALAAMFIDRGMKAHIFWICPRCQQASNLSRIIAVDETEQMDLDTFNFGIAWTRDSGK
jgi:hypothetical protein